MKSRHTTVHPAARLLDRSPAAAVALDAWLGVLPQLIARIAHADAGPRAALHALLTRLGTERSVGRRRLEDCLKGIPMFPEAAEAVREANVEATRDVHLSAWLFSAGEGSQASACGGRVRVVAS